MRISLTYRWSGKNGFVCTDLTKELGRAQVRPDPIGDLRGMGPTKQQQYIRHYKKHYSGIPGKLFDDLERETMAELRN